MHVSRQMAQGGSLVGHTEGSVIPVAALVKSYLFLLREKTLISESISYPLHLAVCGHIFHTDRRLQNSYHFGMCAHPLSTNHVVIFTKS